MLLHHCHHFHVLQEFYFLSFSCGNCSPCLSQKFSEFSARPQKVLGTTRINTNGNYEYALVVIPEIQKKNLLVHGTFKPDTFPSRQKLILAMNSAYNSVKRIILFYFTATLCVWKKKNPSEGHNQYKINDYKAGFVFVVYH